MRIELARFLAALQQGKPMPHGELEETLILDHQFNKELIFKNVTFKKGIIVKNYKNTNPIHFLECTIEKQLFIDGNNELEVLKFEECKINAECLINHSIIKRIELKSSYFKKGLQSEKLTSERLNIKLITSDNGKFVFYQPFISICNIANLRDASDLIFTTFTPELVLSNSGYIKALFLNCDSAYTGMFMIYGPETDIITLNGYNKSGRLLFQDIKAGDLTASQFTNTGLLSLANIKSKAPGMIKLYRSNLGKCEIYGMNFSDFAFITIDNSNIQEIIPTNVQWCQKISSSLTGESKFDHLRETYRQLKNVMIRQNDKIMELTYHRLEMDNYYLSILKKRGHCADRFIIKTNKISNNHGLSYIKPFIILLIMTTIVYIGNNLLLGKTTWKWDTVPKHVALYFESINPVRKFSSIYPEGHEGWQANFAILIDVIFRFLSSYLIFQFISAFRKYVKK